jgi:hypothetical protein
VRDERVDLVEGGGIEQQRNALARSQLAGVVLAAKSFSAAPELGARRSSLRPQTLTIAD